MQTELWESGPFLGMQKSEMMQGGGVGRTSLDVGGVGLALLHHLDGLVADLHRGREHMPPEALGARRGGLQASGNT